MGRRRTGDMQAGFGGGLNTSADESQLQPDEIRVATNALLTEHGAAQKRGGTRLLLSAAPVASTPILAGFNWQPGTGSTTNLFVVDGELYTMPYGSLPLTATQQSTALSTSQVPDFAAFREGGAGGEVVFIADGGLLNYWDGSTLTTNIASTPSVTRLAVYNRRLFGITGTDQTIYWSDLDAGETLGIAASGGGEAIVRTFSDRQLVALAPCAGALLMFHDSGISVFTGWTQDDIDIQAGSSGLTSDVGTRAPRTVVALENEVLFLTDRGFYAATPNSVQPISTKIDADVVGLSAAELAASFAVHFRSRREVWFYIGGIGFYVFNYRTRQWSGPQAGGYISTASTCAWESTDTSGVPIVLVGDAAGRVKRAQVDNNYLDDVAADGSGGTGYETVLQLHRMFCDTGFEASKAWRWGYLLFDPRSGDDVTVEWDTQYGDDSYMLTTSSSAWNTGTWGTGTWGGSGVQPFRVPMSGRGQYVDITIRDASEGGGELYSRFSLEAFDMTRRG